MPTTSESPDAQQDETRPLRPEEQDPALWKGDGWTARIIKSEEDDGWAVEMTRDGEDEPALVGPWTMGRDKKNPKPIDVNAYAVLVKAANEVRMRHLQQLRAKLHRNVTVVASDGTRTKVDLDVVPDEDDPHAILTVHHEAGPQRTRVEPGFKLTVESATKWLDAF